MKMIHGTLGVQCPICGKKKINGCHRRLGKYRANGDCNCSLELAMPC